MAKHTSLYLDEALLREAEEVLGTVGPTGTVRAALEDVVRRARLRNLTTWEVELTPADLEHMLEALDQRARRLDRLDLVAEEGLPGAAAMVRRATRGGRDRHL